MDVFANTKLPWHTTRERLGAVEMCPSPFRLAGLAVARAVHTHTYLTYLQIHADTDTYLNIQTQIKTRIDFLQLWIMHRLY